VQLLKLRYYQVKRDLGIWVILLALLSFFGISAVAESKPLYGFGIVGIIAVLLLVYHLNRKDLLFVQHYLGQASVRIANNYSLLVLPASLALVSVYQIKTAVLLQLIAAGIAFTRSSNYYFKQDVLTRKIPPAQFEFRAGLRTNILVLIPLVFIVLFLSPVKFFLLAALFLMNTVVCSFYQEQEPLLMLNPEGKSVQSFLDGKRKFLQKFFLYSNVPILVINSILHFELIGYNLAIIPALVLLANYTIYAKYASYKPNTKQVAGLDALFVYLATVLPFALPLSYLLVTSYRKKAFLDLEHYCNDSSKNTAV